MPDIFLSYNREDQPVARQFAEGFMAEGLDVWWDVTLRSGEAYDEVTEAALKSAKAVVVLWSPRSVVSRWVRAEATVADRNKTLLPVMIEPCDRPIMFELTQTADLGHWRGETADPAWQSLLTDIRRFVAREMRPAAVAPPATAAAKPASAPSGSRSARGGVPSLAVLPFTNRSGLPEDDVFAFGMVEDIIDAMSQGVEVRVIASSATARFRTGAIPDLDAMAKQLGVRYVLEGNVRRVGQDIRVTTQLVDASSGAILWTQKFDRPLAQLANLQEEMVLEVASHLRTQAHRLEIERALRKPGNLTAWEAVMRSIAAYRRMNGSALMQAIVEARTAVEIAPDYALAVALLAQTQGILYNQVLPDDEAEAVRIRDLAETAVALEPDNPVVLSTAAGAFSTSGFPQRALEVSDRAISLNPNNEFAHFARGQAMALLGRTEDSIASFERERQLAPGHPVLWISYLWRAVACIKSGRWDDAADAYRQSMQLTPDNAAPHIGLALTMHHLGHLDEAIRHFRIGRNAEPDTRLSTWRLRYKRSNAGAPTAAVCDEILCALWAASDGEAAA